MSCPNATHDRGDGRCSGTQMVALQTTNRSLSGLRVPCPSCWQAAGNPPVPKPQHQALTWWSYALGRLVNGHDDQQLQLLEMQDNAAVEGFNDAERMLRDRDVDPVLKTKWHAWMMSHREVAA